MKNAILSLVILIYPLAIHAQKVGVGTASPAYTFTIKDSTGANGYIGLAQVSPNGSIAAGTYVDNGAAYIQTHTNNDLHFSTNNSTPQVTLQKGTGNLGIGRDNPEARLDINGSIKITDGTQASGKVLTSDANGAGSWQEPGISTKISTTGFNAVRNLYYDVYASGGGTQTVQFATASPFCTSCDAAFDEGTNYDMSTGYEAPGGGMYHFDWNLSIDEGIPEWDTEVVIYVSVNGSVFATFPYQAYMSKKLADLKGSINLKLNGGDKVKLIITQAIGSDIYISGGPETFFSGYRVY